MFTKLLKPIYATLRNQGYVSAGFIDNSILIADSLNECTANIKATTGLMSRVGFIINDDKSILVPTANLRYSGNIIDSGNIIVTLP